MCVPYTVQYRIRSVVPRRFVARSAPATARWGSASGLVARSCVWCALLRNLWVGMVLVRFV